MKRGDGRLLSGVAKPVVEGLSSVGLKPTDESLATERSVVFERELGDLINDLVDDFADSGAKASEGDWVWALPILRRGEVEAGG